MFYVFDYFIIGVYYGFIALGFFSILSLFYYLFIRFSDVYKQFKAVQSQSLKSDDK